MHVRGYVKQQLELKKLRGTIDRRI